MVTFGCNLFHFLGGATLEGWDSCVKGGVRYATDAVLATASGVSSPEECTTMCQLTNDCRAITHSGTSCRMMTNDSVTVADKSAVSVSLRCLQGNWHISKTLFAVPTVGSQVLI